MGNLTAMKSFTVTVGGETKTLQGPDDATQDQAQAEADRQFQARGIDKDFSGETGRQGITNPLTGKPTGILGGDFGANIGRKAANVAHGAAELVGVPIQAMGGQTGAAYNQAEAEPTTTGDKWARVAGAALPLAPFGAAGVGASRAVGGLEGFAAPASSPTQRGINTAAGTITGGFGRGPAMTALDRLAGTATGMIAGHGLGGGGWFPTLLGGSIGRSVGHEAHEAVAGLLRHFPPSVVARALVQLGEPFSKLGAEAYDYIQNGPPKDGQGTSQGSGPAGR